MPLSDRELADEIGSRCSVIVDEIHRLYALSQYFSEEHDARTQMGNVRDTLEAALKREQEAL